jgi:hypothetical protein
VQVDLTPDEHNLVLEAGPREVGSSRNDRAIGQEAVR